MTALIPCSRPPLSATDYSYLDGTSGSDRTILWVSLLVAVILHLVAGMISLPASDPIVVYEPSSEPTRIHEFQLQPPKQKPKVHQSNATPNVRRVPVPSRTEPNLEPVREESEWVEPSELSAPVFTGVDLLVEPVPPTGLLYDETKPGLILPQALADRIEPIYPRIGIMARRGGVVHLSAIITEEGEVAEIELLRAPDPDLGFSAAAIEAVTHWRYEPGRYHGRPVSVRMTVIVEFLLD